MPDNDDVVKCPLCQGHGELRRLELAERLKSREWKAAVERWLAGSAAPAQEPTSSLGNVHQGPDFQKEVHQWNRELPIFRRSPKE
jgi:hypothetical protein